MSKQWWSLSRLIGPVIAALAIGIALDDAAGCNVEHPAELLEHSASALEVPHGVTVKGRQLELDGKPFQVRGVNYSPIPIGGSIDGYRAEANKLLGDGGDVFANPYYENIWKADLVKMKDMGVNTIRVYAMHPWEPQVGPEMHRSHKAFLDLAQANGIHVIAAFPISNSVFRYKLATTAPTDGSWFLRDGANIWVADETRKEDGWKFNGAQTAAQRQRTDLEAYEALAHELGEHPAVFGFVIGNEINTPQNVANPKFWAYINHVAERLHAPAPQKLTTMTMFDDSMQTLRAVQKNGYDVSHIDFWGINSYRGRLGDANEGFNDLFSTYAQASTKPFVVTEFGAPHTTRKEIVAGMNVPTPRTDDAAAQGKKLHELCEHGVLIELPARAKLAADYVESHWKDIDNNKNIAAGGIVFEWQDEYVKAGTREHLTGLSDVWSQSNSPGASAAFPGGCRDEEGFGLNAVTLKRGRDNWNGPKLQLDPRMSRAAFDRLKTLWTR